MDIILVATYNVSNSKLVADLQDLKMIPKFYHTTFSHTQKNHHHDPLPKVSFPLIIKSLMRLIGAVVDTSDYESPDLTWIADKGSRRTAHPAVHPPKRVGREMGTKGNCEDGFQSGPVSRGNGLFFHQRLKEQCDGRWAPAATCSYSVCPLYLMSEINVMNNLLILAAALKLLNLYWVVTQVIKL